MYSELHCATTVAGSIITRFGLPQKSDLHRKMGISEATFYNWKKKFSGLGTAELRRLRQLEDENARLKQVVADLTLDKQMLQDVLKKKF